MDPHDIWRTAARREPGDVQAAPADGDVNGLDERSGPRRLPVDAYYFGLLDRLVQVITLESVALRGDDHRRLPARTAERIQHVEPIERVLDGVVHPREVGDDHVKSQAVTDSALDRGLVLGDPYPGASQGLSQNGFDDLSQCGSD